MIDTILIVAIFIITLWLIIILINGPSMVCRDGMVTNFSKLRGTEKQNAIKYILGNIDRNRPNLLNNGINRSGMGNATDIEENFLQSIYGSEWEKDPEPVQLTDPNKPKPYELVEAVYGGIPYYLYEWRDLKYGPEWYPKHRPAIMNSKTWFQKTLKLRDADFWNVEREKEGKRIVDVAAVLQNKIYESPIVE
jgi:hypothetical protein